MMKNIFFTSALVFVSAMSGEAMAACSGTQLTGDNGTRETAVVTFSALTAGQSLTVAGLTYTLSANRNANQISNAFNGLNDGDTSGPPNQANFGTYSGTFTGWRSTPGGPANTKTFTSVAFGNVTNIVTSTTGPALGVATTDGTGAPSLANLLRGNTVCVGTTGNWQAQEFHQPGGNLIDWKMGANDPVDPTASVGSWNITGTNTGTPTDARIRYTYGSDTYNNTVWLNQDGTYSFCNQLGNETIAAKIINGQASCQ